MALANIYDWNQVRAALRQLRDAFPGLLENVVLIGGGACWFYREALRQWQVIQRFVSLPPVWSNALAIALAKAPICGVLNRSRSYS